MTLVLDLGRYQQHVRLRTAGFESCVVTTPPIHAAVRLASHYSHPWRARADVFVDELLAASIEPEHSPSAIRALPEIDRAVLRRALVAAVGCTRQWRSLYGSHLTGDERLFAVMYWQWQRQMLASERLRTLLDARVASTREATSASIGVRSGLPGVSRSPSVVDFVLGTSTKKLAITELVSPKPAVGMKALQAHTASWRDTTKLFQSPLTSAFAHLSRMTSTFNAFEHVRALTQSPAFELTRPARSELATALSIPRIQSPLAALRTEKLLEQWTHRGAFSAALGWTAPSGLTEMARLWEHQSKGLMAVMGLRPGGPSMTALLGGNGYITDALDALRHFERIGEPLREMAETVQLVDDFDRRWQNEALYFIVSGFLAVCDLWEMRKLAALTRDEVEEAVLLALEAVVTDGRFVAALRAALAKAPFLNPSQRTNLDHALEHAAAGEYVHACASLYWGLEGAFWEVGYATAVVTLQRTDPNRTTRSVGFESMVKRLKLGPELKTFMVRGLYGTTGNPYRHGGAASGERRQVLLGVAALAGWFEEFTSVQALTALVTGTGRALPAAVSRVSNARQQLRS